MRKRGAGNTRFAALFFSPSRASARRESAERETHDSRRLSSVPRARPREAPARSGQSVNRGAFLQPLARVRETRQRGVGNARFAAAFSAPCAHPGDAKARSGQRANRGGFLQPLARLHETRQRGAGNSRFAAAFFNLSRESARRESAERATRDSRRLSSTSRAHPGDAKARSGQRANHGGFLQPLARIRETRKRGAGNVRIAAAFFSPLRASARCESAERATRDSRRFHSAPRAHPGDAPARSRQRSNRGAFPQSPRARPRDAKARSGQLAIRGGFLQPLARIRETRQRGAGNARFAALSFSPSRASARRASVE